LVWTFRGIYPALEGAHAVAHHTAHCAQVITEMIERVTLQSPIQTRLQEKSPVTCRVSIQSPIVKTKLKVRGPLTKRVVLSSAIDAEEVQ